MYVTTTRRRLVRQQAALTRVATIVAEGVPAAELFAALTQEVANALETFRPALTTVRAPLGEMGRTAVNVLVRLLERRASQTPHIELATRLVVRESTAPPRRSAAG